MSVRIVGTIRKIDELGRLVIPKEYRDRLNLVEHTPVEVVVVY